MSLIRHQTIGVMIMVATDEAEVPVQELEPPRLPSPPNTPPTETRRFVCWLPDGSHAVLRLPAERYRDPARRLSAAVGGALGLTVFWLAIALFVLFVPIIGM